MASTSQHSRLQAEESLSVFDTKQRCFKCIDECVAHQNVELSANAMELRQMLHLWARHSWVDSRPGMSLDDRLKNNPDLKVTIVGLLELIEQRMTQTLSSSIDNASTIIPGPSASTTDNKTFHDSQETLIKQKWDAYRGTTWEEVSAAVDMLIELTALIRRSTGSTWDSSLAAEPHRSDDYFEEHARALVRREHPSSRKSLSDQLGNTIFLRRRHMLYRMKHEEKLSFARTDVDVVSGRLSSAMAANDRMLGSSSQILAQSTSPQQPSANSLLLAAPPPSETNLSQINKDILHRRIKHVGALSGITEGSVSFQEKDFSHMYPEPPTIGDAGKAACPYCGKILSAKDLTTGLWRKHLHEDLKPYVCFSEDCISPVRSFADSRNWLQHMVKSHGHDWAQKVHMRTWYCDVGHKAVDKIEFKAEKELQDHIFTEHKELIDAHAKAIIRRNWGLGCREKHICPLCEALPPKFDAKMNEQDKAARLFQHIGDELTALALFSLPSLGTEASDMKSQSSKEDRISVRGVDAVPNTEGRHSAPPMSQSSLTFDEDPYRWDRDLAVDPPFKDLESWRETISKVNQSSHESQRTSDNGSSRKRKEKKAKLKQKRQRYLEHAYITIGIPPDTDSEEDESQDSANSTDSDTRESTSPFHDSRTAQPEVGVRSVPLISAGAPPEPLPTSLRDGTPGSINYAPVPITSRSQSQTQFEQTFATPGLSPESRPPQSIFYADVIDSEGRRCEVQISDDTGTPDNWIHPFIVKENRLAWEDLDKPRYYEDANGKKVKTERFVNLEWIGKDNRQYNNRFYVGSPKVSIPRLTLGNSFVRSYGRAFEICRLDQRVQDAKILTQAPITAREANAIQANGARADASAANLERARESTSSRRKHNTSTRHKGKKSETSETRHTPTVHENDQFMGPLAEHYGPPDSNYYPPFDDNATYDSPVTNLLVDRNNTNDSSGINWGPWARLPNGLWHREGQDSLGDWFEENRDEDPSFPRNVPRNVPCDSSGINWGPWERLPNGQWRREGQDSSGIWYEDHQDEDPR